MTLCLSLVSLYKHKHMLKSGAPPDNLESCVSLILWFEQLNQILNIFSYVIILILCRRHGSLLGYLHYTVSSHFLWTLSQFHNIQSGYVSIHMNHVERRKKIFNTTFSFTRTAEHCNKQPRSL